MRCRFCDKPVSQTRLSTNFLALLDQVDPSESHVTVDQDWKVLSSGQTASSSAAAATSQVSGAAEADADVIILDDD